jgi:hypothetical protein
MTKHSRRLTLAIAAISVFIGTVFSAALHPVQAAPPRHIGPPALYPDANLTPGSADTLSPDDLKAEYTDGGPNHHARCSYSQAHRNVSKDTAFQIYDEYHVPRDARNIQHGEVDHFYPICAGGSNDISNLWYQPAINIWNGRNFGYHQKDDLETWVCEQIKQGQLEPKVAFDRITADWVKYYLEVQPPLQHFGR